MIRLFVRFSLVTLGAAFASFVLLMIFHGSAQDAFIKPRAALEMEGLASLLQEQLRGIPAEQVQDRLDEMAKDSGFHGHRIPVDEWIDLQRNGMFFQFEGTPYLIEITTNETVAEGIRTREGIALLATLAAMIGLSVGSGLFLAVPLVRKLNRQEKTLLQIADGDLTARVEVGSPDALGRLGERINMMAARIQELLQSHRDLIGTVSHEMRTPVARLQFSLELLEGSNEEMRRQHVTSMQEDIEELDELLEEILTFQHLESGTPMEQRESIELLPLLDRITHRGAGENAGENAGILVRLAPENRSSPLSPRLWGHHRMLTRSLENIVRNAVRFASKEVIVSFEILENSATICVLDDGPGIPSQERERVFEPFVTLSDGDQGKATTGLGLAIARHIIHDHGGTISIAQHERGGALFRITLPLDQGGSPKRD